MKTTAYNEKYLARELTQRCSADSGEKLAQADAAPVPARGRLKKVEWGD